MDLNCQRRLKFAENFVLGGIAAAVSATGAAPFERIKLLIQSQGELLKTGRLEAPYRGVIDCTKRTFISEGMLQFWRGNTVTVIRYFPSQALSLALKDKYQDAFTIWRPQNKVTLFAKNAIAGSAAGVTSLLVVYPLDFARTRMANDTKVTESRITTRQFKSIYDVCKRTFMSDGIAGLYRGFVVSSAGILVHRGISFGLFDTLRPILLKDRQSLPNLFMLGYGVTITSSVFYYPFDTIRRRMMMTSGEPVKYKGAIDCAVKIVKTEGTKSLFKGFTANIFKSVAGAAVLSGYKKLEDIYRKWRKL